MIFFFMFILIIQFKIYREYMFKYGTNNELLVERIKRGKEAFYEILKAKKKAEEEYAKKQNKNEYKEYEDSLDDNNIYVKEIKCYEYVLYQLNNLNMYNCNEINENSKSLLALAKTKCIFVKSVRNFPDEKSGCILNPKNLNKLQIYLYNNNMFDQFQNENIAETLSLDELRKIENIKNPCLYDTDPNEEYPNIAGELPLKNNESNYNIYNNSDNIDEYNLRYKNNTKNYYHNNSYMPNGKGPHNDININKKLCENLKYKIVTNCTGNGNMSDTAFQIYHSELNHIDDICFYIQSVEWNKRTEENINRLAETSLYITKQMTTNLENMKLIEHAQIKQIENTNRFDNFLKGLKSDFSDIIAILSSIKRHHESISRFVKGFRMFVIYFFILIIVLFITSRSYAYNSRTKIISCIFFCFLSELLFKKIVMLIQKYMFLVINDNIVNYSIKGIRYVFAGVCLKVFITTIISYREPAKKIEEELKYIKCLIEDKIEKYKYIKTENERNDANIDQHTASILKLWLNYNEDLDNIYDDDKDFNIYNISDTETSSSSISLVSENLSSEEIFESNDEFIGRRIKTMHRTKRPLFFHYFPSPKNVKAYTENPITFINIINEKHKEIMKIRAQRLKYFESNEYSDSNKIIMETNEDNSQRNLSDLNENMKK
ncbi:nuclear fusion protein [Plasmodium berghei]|uniref:Nuclear fusion protein n=2 Tax=Plasmodium berghei TaxID=5821 RepID=A0A509APZ0_PLABA|nr:nuclear fusion protein [Plasmodium berghei ANKA]CXI68643.1 nuclear fusion protein [Plasmodium berghei]SCM24205.1 nuclear fusion protein [Plasmodium berghei]SCN26988.1 nuclear fusion protein [Plasmodium berghei]SCO61432.1 nuclear fusion protein [Plasmodium berghei]SCO63409.1 nuclear fusion protein [Plasmodium berghei]|eukprot:XP_034422604.1 nuclear fusion protein [Plasmodium berghei ANKA]